MDFQQIPEDVLLNEITQYVDDNTFYKLTTMSREHYDSLKNELKKREQIFFSNIDNVSEAIFKQLNLVRKEGEDIYINKMFDMTNSEINELKKDHYLKDENGKEYINKVVDKIKDQTIDIWRCIINIAIYGFKKNGRINIVLSKWRGNKLLTINLKNNCFKNYSDIKNKSYDIMNNYTCGTSRDNNNYLDVCYKILRQFKMSLDRKRLILFILCNINTNLISYNKILN